MIIIKKVSGVLRVLGGFIDYIIILLVVQMVLVVFLKLGQTQVELLFKFLFAVYGVLFAEYMQGATIGKRIGKIKIISKDNCKPKIMELGMRELTKSIYLIPYIGWAIGIVNIAIILVGSGRTLHDYIAGTKVIYTWDEVEVINEG